MKLWQRERFPWLVGALSLLSVAVPYLWAWRLQGEGHVFMGFLLNPLDGLTYLAKMRQGWEGAWRYALAFTDAPGEGAYLQMFYLLLGHLARWTRLPLVLTFHLARLAGSVFLLAMLWRFYNLALADPQARRLAFLLTALGGGMGWLALLFGLFTMDFWVAEAYPFLSMYANPHFPLSLALLLLLLSPRDTMLPWQVLLIGFVLSWISPFAVVIAALLHAALSLFGLREMGRWDGKKVFWLLLGGAPALAYDLWIACCHPVLRVWHAQNQTPTPPLWNLLVGLSPVLLLALWEIAGRQRARWPDVDVMTLWGVLALALALFPFGLQRRFLLGIYIPLAGLAAQPLSRWLSSRRRLGAGLLLFAALPTGLVVILAGLSAARQHDPTLYLRRDERIALNWMASNLPPEAVVLASPQSGAFIPAFSGQRVLYGHPFETPHADQQRSLVEAFFQGKMSAQERAALLRERQVAAVFYGPREQVLGDIPSLPGFELAFQEGDVRVFVLPAGGER